MTSSFCGFNNLFQTLKHKHIDDMFHDALRDALSHQSHHLWHKNIDDLFPCSLARWHIDNLLVDPLLHALRQQNHDLTDLFRQLRHWPIDEHTQTRRLGL